jgi:hypothetical protein
MQYIIDQERLDNFLQDVIDKYEEAVFEKEDQENDDIDLVLEPIRQLVDKARELQLELKTTPTK